MQVRPEDIKRKYEHEWLRMKGVTAVGLGQVEGVIGIIISVEKAERKIRAQIPTVIEGIPVKVELADTLRAQ
jgi:hypothetical protein